MVKSDLLQSLRTDLGSLVRLIVTRSDATIERPVYLMLGESVYSEDRDLWLKSFYDDGWPVRIAATSSATAALRDRQHKMESVVGQNSI